MSVKVILENALSQLDAQKTQTYKQAYDAKTAELTSEYDAYRIAKKQEYDDAVLALKARYDAAMSAKKEEIDEKAKLYADIAVAAIDKNIADLKAMIEKEV